MSKYNNAPQIQQKCINLKSIQISLPFSVEPEKCNTSSIKEMSRTLLPYQKVFRQFCVMLQLEKYH